MSHITPIPPGGTKPAVPSGQIVQIVSLPDALKNVARAMRIEGEVISHNQDGTTRIKTSDGDIDILLRGRQLPPGSKIEIDIPAGNPPRQATVRPAPAAPQTPAPQPAPSTNTPPQTPVVRPPPVTGQPQPAPPTGTPQPQTPLPNTYQPPAPGTAQPQTGTLPPLNSGQIVRLTPMMPAPAISATGLQIMPDSILSSKLSLASFQSDLIAKGATDTLHKSLLQTIRPVAAMLTQTTQGAITMAAQTQIPVMTPPTPSMTPMTMMAKNDLGIAQLLQSVMGSGAGTPESIIPVTFSAPRLMQLDVKIMDIKLPNVQLASTAPDSAIPSIAIKGMDASLIKPQGIASFIGDARPSTLTGIITGFTPQNLPVIAVQWPNGALSQNFTLQFAAGNLQIGSQITLLPQAPAVGTALPPQLFRGFLQAATPWPVLDDMYQALMQVSPQSAQAMARVIPSPANGLNMGAAALLFIASVRAGDLGGWLGDKRIEALGKASKSDFLSRLTGETTAATRAASESPGDWRSYPLPLLWQNEISKVMFHIKRDGGDAEQEDNDGSARFVMDLSLTRMGDVQLDGMLRDKRLDLIVRTQIPVSHSMQSAMKNAYTNALDGTDLHGDLVFQGDIKHWMHVVRRDEHLGVSA